MSNQWVNHDLFLVFLPIIMWLIILEQGVKMGFVLVIIGGLLLRYWWAGMSTPPENRPSVLSVHGEKIAFAGLALVILGTYQLF